MVQLAFTKLKHWCVQIRRLAAASIALMTCLNPRFVVEELLLGLVHECLNENLSIRHGAAYGVAEILIGISGNGHLHNMKNEMSSSVFFKTLTINE